jgi:hypothetical protein
MGPYLEKILYKTRAGGVGQGIGPEFKPPYCQKKKKKATYETGGDICKPYI